MPHGPPPPVTARSVQMNVMRTSPPVLLLAVAAMAIIALCQLINRAEAGGKGKGGRQGHIIIQNDVKSNPVPIYMPIPIPIPMPMGGGGGGGGGGKPPGYHNHHQPQHDGEGEVRKIYLLQPMAPARPQPHLKGGGFMGVPVQNNIHLGPGMAHHQLSMMSPGKHRHGGGKTSLTFDSFSEQQVPLHQHQVQQEEHKHVKSAASEVKILPIVVIPPMAPMPPVQVPSAQQQQQVAASHVPRMTLTPQFNNYVLAAGAGSHDRRRSSGGGGHSRGSGAGQHRTESFSEYGGSLGGSVFRERFAGAGRLRPPTRARTFRIVAESEMPAGPRQQRLPPANDFDYADYEQQQGSSSSSSSSSISGADLRALEELMQQRRSNRWRRGDYQPQRSQSQNLLNHRIKSIRDVIDLQSEQDEVAAAAASGIDDYDGQRHLSAMRSDLADGAGSSDSLMSLRASGFAQRGLRAPAAGSMEISLDELGLAAASYGSDQRADHYGDRPDSLPTTTTADGYRGPRPPRTPTSSLTGSYRLPRADERDLFDDETDEWRSDTLKSVRHAAPANETKAAETGSGATRLTTLKSSSSSLSRNRTTKLGASKGL